MDIMPSRTHRTIASALTSVLLLAALVTGCGSADASAQKAADKFLPGLLTVMTTSRSTMPGGLMPTVFATYRVNDDPDAVVDVYALSEDVLREALAKGRWEAAELRAVQSAFAEHNVPVVGMGRPTLREDGIAVGIIVVADLSEGTVRDVQGRLDAAVTDWQAARSSGTFPEVTGDISSLSISIVDPERLAGLPEAPGDLPTVARLSFPERSYALGAATSAVASVLEGDDGRLRSARETLAPRLDDKVQATLSARTIEAARAWVAKEGLDHEVNQTTAWQRYEPDTIERLRIYVLLCPPGVSTCNTSSSDHALGLTIDLTTLKVADPRLVTAIKLPGGGWETPLEPQRFTR